jgi:hypothetical protein
MYPVPWNVAHGVFVRDHVAAVVGAGAQAEVVQTVAWVPPWMGRRRARNHLSAWDPGGAAPVHYATTLRPPWRRFHRLMGPLTLMAVARHVARIRERFPFDIVHSHEVTPVGLAGVRLAQRDGVVSVCTAHGSDLNVAPLISKACHRQTAFVIENTSQVVAVSNVLARRARG